MSVDWNATGSMLSGWGTIAGAGAVAYAAHRAADTIATWKRQRIAERRFDHAERTLAATYKVREAIDQIRSPLIHGVEIEKAKAELTEDPKWVESLQDDKRKRLFTGQVYVMRIRGTEEAWDDLRAVLPLAKALFDDNLEEALRKLLHVRWLIRVNADSYVDGDGGDREFGIKVRRELNSQLADGADELSQYARSQIDIIEATCLPVLRET